MCPGINFCFPVYTTENRFISHSLNLLVSRSQCAVAVFFSFPSRIGAPKWLDVICEIFFFCLLCLIAINKHLVLPVTAGHRRCPRQQNKVICKLQGLVLIALSTSECWQRLTKLFDFSCSCSPVNRAPVNKLKVQMLLLDVHACVALCIMSLALEKWSICFCVFSENFFLHILAFT